VGPMVEKLEKHGGRNTHTLTPPYGKHLRVGVISYTISSIRLWRIVQWCCVHKRPHILYGRVEKIIRTIT